MPCLLILLVVWPRLVGARQRLRPRHKSSAPCNPVWNQEVDAMRIARCVGTRQRLGSPARSGCRCACADKPESAAISTSAIIDVPCLARGWGLVSARGLIFLPCQQSGLVLFVLHDPLDLCRSPARGWDQAMRWRMHGSFEHGHPWPCLCMLQEHASGCGTFSSPHTSRSARASRQKKSPPIALPRTSGQPSGRAPATAAKHAPLNGQAQPQG